MRESASRVGGFAKASRPVLQSGFNRQGRQGTPRDQLPREECTQRPQGFNGQEKTTQSISETERERLRKFLNAELHVVVDKNGRRGIHVAWSRSGHGIGQTIYDTQENFDAGSFWKGMPERIEALIFPTVVKGAPALAATTPDSARSFANSEEAISWGMTKLNAPVEEVSAIYGEVKAAAKPKSSREMWAAWVAEVEKRQMATTAAASTASF